jgi:hypothetical protein
LPAYRCVAFGNDHVPVTRAAVALVQLVGLDRRISASLDAAVPDVSTSGLRSVAPGFFFQAFAAGNKHAPVTQAVVAYLNWGDVATWFGFSK